MADYLYSDALLVTATLNSLGTLVKLRASIANKVISAVLNFNPFVLAQNGPITVKSKVMVKSMTRTHIVFLTNILKRYVGGTSHVRRPRSL